MYKKITNLVFVLIFILTCTIPLLFSNLVQGTPSIAENRMLHGIAKVFKWDGSFNKEVLNEFDGWIDDNIGFRSKIVEWNAKIQYYVFDRLTHNSTMSIGPKGILNTGSEKEFMQYQHLDLKSEEELLAIADSFQKVSNYLEENGIQYYYMPLYEKYSIYPEHMPKYIIQYGDVSRIDQIVDVLDTKTNINIVLLKDKLIEAKKEYEPYCEYGDPGHWTQRGSYIGYCELMKLINQNGNNYPILQEEDFNITITDQGANMFGDIHVPDYFEDFDIKEKYAVESTEGKGIYEEDIKIRYLKNDKVGNKTRTLIIADSYIEMYLLDEFSETFHEVIWVHADKVEAFKEYVEYFQPDIVIHENAECTERYGMIIEMSKTL